MAVYSIDPSRGTLTAANQVTLSGGARPLAIATDPSSRFLFVSRSGGRGGIDVYAIDRTTGRLDLVNGSPFDLDHQTDDLVIDPNGRFLRAIRTFNGLIDTFAVDPTSGALTLLNVNTRLDLAVAPIAPVLRPDGKFLFFGASALNQVTAVSIDGSAMPFGSSVTTQVPDAVRTLSIEPTGSFLYVTTSTPFSSETLFCYRINATTGALARVSGSVFAPGFDAAVNNFRPGGVTFDATGRFAFVLDRAVRTGSRSRGVFVFPVQAGVLGPSFVGPFSTPATEPFLVGDPSAFALDPSGHFAYIADATTSSLSVFTVDLSTGGLSPAGSPVPVPLGLTHIVVSP